MAGDTIRRTARLIRNPEANVALYIVATPLGTLGDISPRAREVLSTASCIFCEDTRHTRGLLSALSIPAPPLRALHAHNESETAQAVAALAQSADVALVSDAGTPVVSDPGRIVVEACLASGVQVLSVPGPSALAAALAASGLPAAPSSFFGFPPRKGLSGFLSVALQRADTLVFFEAPQRVSALVNGLCALAPAREVAVCREISKKFEEIIRGPLPEVSQRLAERKLRGECVVVVGPGEPLVPELSSVDSSRLKDIAANLAERWRIPKREAYAKLLALEQQVRDDES